MKKDKVKISKNSWGTYNTKINGVKQPGASFNAEAAAHSTKMSYRAEGKPEPKIKFKD